MTLRSMAKKLGRLEALVRQRNDRNTAARRWMAAPLAEVVRA